MFGIILSLAVVGLILVIAEMFLPWMVAGVLGGIAFLAAVALSYSTYGFDAGNLVLVGVAFLNAGIFACWVRMFPGSALARKMTLVASVKRPFDHPDHTALVGREGVSLTQLRPSGTALVDGRRIDVMAEGGFIAAQERLKIIQVEGAKVVVRKQST